MMPVSLRTFGGTVGALVALACVLGASAWPLSARAAGIEGISYTLTPSYEIVRWGDELGLKDTELWGGRSSINFGKYVSLQGYYMLRDGVRTDLGSVSLADSAGAPLVDQDVDLRNYGTDVVMNLGRGSTVPFLKAGAGVLHLKTADGDQTDQINLKLGGGFRFGIDRLQAVIYAEDSAMRLNRYDLAANSDTDPGFPSDPDADRMRHSLTVGAGVDFALGGYSSDSLTEIDRAVAERFRSGLRGVSVPVEPFVGSLRYDDKVGLSAQDFVGIRTGLDFGPFFGLRGYYWRGVTHEFDDTDPIHSYGGEAQFNLNAGQGGIPYVIVGAGQLDFGDDFTDGTGAGRDDRTMLIVGGGLSFTLGDRIKLDVSARDYLFSQGELEDVSSTDQLTNNIALAVGARFSFGAGYDRTGRPLPSSTEPSVGPGVETRTVASTGETTPDADSTATQPPVIVETTNFHGERHVTIPVPTEGEIYVRYGRPGGVEIESRFEGRDMSEGMTPALPLPGAEVGSVAVDSAATTASPTPTPTPGLTSGLTPGATSGLTPGLTPPATTPSLDADAIRAVIRDELSALEALREPNLAGPETESAYGSLSTAQQMELLERRLADRMDVRIQNRMQGVEDLIDETPDTIVIRDEQPDVTLLGAAPQTVARTGMAERWKAQSARFYLGANVDDPNQTIFGGRVDLGPLSPGSNVHFVPELALGFGSDATSYMVAVNLRYEFQDTSVRGTWSPYAALGGGVLGFSKDLGGRAKQEGVLNLTYGLTANLGRTIAFAEHQGVDLFDLNRINLGLKWKFGQ